MARFEDTSGLFGQGGGGTGGNIKCEWCGKNHTGRENKGGEAKSSSETIYFDNFGDLQVCDCCFEEVEAAVLPLMPRIVPWFIRILQSKRRHLEQHEAMVAALRVALKEG